MGTPEFPDLGKHCSVDDCKQIDFLPFSCDRCKQVFCLEHRSHIKHQCPSADPNDVTVLICPLCAKGVRVVPNEDPNITWESHVNTDCDPSNYEKVTKKKRCPAPGCKEVLTFSNTIRCRDCMREHCLKHRFGLDHKCVGPPKKSDAGFPFVGLLKRSQKNNSKTTQSSNAPSAWATNLVNAASSVRASAEAGMAKLSIATNQALQKAREGMAQSSSSGAGEEEYCLQCQAKFSSVKALIEHVERVHEQGGRVGPKKVTIDVCPKCSRGFRDPVSLVEHVERDHGGTSVA
ncbi:zinc finger AN1 and C2H2 domain-containing stress-associated protein 16-like [Aristolochia californica]|uniref:zinc finger AN1 and C2H2 domain-containing stress-associated protein 16-like n=1 Tax=Aristolochia californica TaxID=171875 RepID=UPI0035E3B087